MVNLDLYHAPCFLISPSALRFTSLNSTAFLRGWRLMLLSFCGGRGTSTGTHRNNSVCLRAGLWGLNGMPLPQSSRCWTGPRANTQQFPWGQAVQCRLWIWSVLQTWASSHLHEYHKDTSNSWELLLWGGLRADEMTAGWIPHLLFQSSWGPRIPLHSNSRSEGRNCYFDVREVAKRDSITWPTSQSVRGLDLPFRSPDPHWSVLLSSRPHVMSHSSATPCCGGLK